MTPFAYSLKRDRYSEPLLFSSLDNAVGHLIAVGASPSFCRGWQNPVQAHYEDQRVETVDVASFMEQVPVDRAAIRAERDAAVARDRAKFDEVYPEGRPPGRRISGDHWLCEYSPEELERMLEEECEKRSWVWRTKP